MKWLFFFFLSLNSFFTFSQPSIDWATNYAGIYKVQYDYNNNFIYTLGVLSATHISILPSNYSPTTANCFQDSINGEEDIYLSKFDTLGNRIWATYFGGNGSENIGHSNNQALGITSDGSIIIAGFTTSSQDLVTIGSPGSQNPNYPLNSSGNNPNFVGEGCSGFLAKFDSNGNRIWSRYFGDSVVNLIHNITLDQNDNIIVVASANGFNQIPAISSAHQVLPANTLNTSNNGYLAKFNSNDGALEWWTYYGGPLHTHITGLTTDSNNNIYFSGRTDNAGMATPNAYYSIFTNGTTVSFLTKFNTAGQQIWCTYLMDSTTAALQPCQLLSDGGETIYRMSRTSVNGLATVGSYQPGLAGGSDLLLASFDPTNGYPNWITYYGTKWYDQEISFTLNKSKDILIIGQTQAPGKVLNTECSIATDDYLNFIAKFSKSGNRVWASYYYLGDSSNYPNGIRFSDIVTGNNLDFYSVSYSYGPGLTTAGAFFSSNNPQNLNLITKFQDAYLCPDRYFDITQNGDTLFVIGGYEQYIWYKNGIAIGGSDSFLIIDFSDADYYVKIEDGCGCSYQTDIFGVTSISEKEHMVAIRLFPNPNKGKFWLKGMINMPQENLLYTVSDLSGKVLQEGSFRVKNRIIDQEIDCSELTAGMYFLELKLKEGRVALKLVVED